MLNVTFHNITIKIALRVYILQRVQLNVYVIVQAFLPVDKVLYTSNDGRRLRVIVGSAVRAAETSAVNNAADDERPTPRGVTQMVGAVEPEVDERMLSTFDEK